LNSNPIFQIMLDKNILNITVLGCFIMIGLRTAVIQNQYVRIKPVTDNKEERIFIVRYSPSE